MLVDMEFTQGQQIHSTTVALLEAHHSSHVACVNCSVHLYLPYAIITIIMQWLVGSGINAKRGVASAKSALWPHAIKMPNELICIRNATLLACNANVEMLGIEEKVICRNALLES